LRGIILYYDDGAKGNIISMCDLGSDN